MQPVPPLLSPYICGVFFLAGHTDLYTIHMSKGKAAMQSKNPLQRSSKCFWPSEGSLRWGASRPSPAGELQHYWWGCSGIFRKCPKTYRLIKNSWKYEFDPISFGIRRKETRRGLLLGRWPKMSGIRIWKQNLCSTLRSACWRMAPWLRGERLHLVGTPIRWNRHGICLGGWGGQYINFLLMLILSSFNFHAFRRILRRKTGVSWVGRWAIVIIFNIIIINIIIIIVIIITIIIDTLSSIFCQCGQYLRWSL